MQEYKLEFTIRIADNIKDLYNNYSINYDSKEDFLLYLINNIETDTETEGKSINHLKEWGWDIVCTNY